MYLYGASGHAKVVIEILELLNIPVTGLFDDNPSGSSLLNYGIAVLGNVPDLHGGSLIITIGDNRSRKKIAGKLEVSYGKAIHPSANISSRSQIGDGTVIMTGVTMNVDAKVGKHCIINTNASIDHDCLLEDFVHISPNATLCGNVSVGEGSQIGAGAVVIPGAKIGKWAIVGAGSVIIKDVPDQVTVVGNPGRMIGS